MLLGFVCVALAFLLSSHFVPWTAFQQELCAAVGVAFIGGSALLRRGAWRWPVLAVTVALSALIPLVQFSAGLLLYQSDGVLAMLYLLGFALSISVGARLVSTQRDDLLNGLFGVFLFSALVSVWVALCQWLNVEPGFFAIVPALPGGRVVGNMGQPNHLATLLFLGLVSAGWFYQSRHFGKVVLCVIALVLCVGMALTQSRQVWVGLAALACWVAFVRKRSGVTIPAWSIVAFGLLLASALLALRSLNDTLFVSEGRSASELMSQGTRLSNWGAMIDAISRAPWFGYGWNELAVAQGAVAADHPATHEMLDHSHNLLLDLIIWNGVPLGLLLGGVLAWWICRHVRACRDPASALLLAALTGVIAHALFEYPLSYTYFLLPTGLILGAVDGLSPIDNGLQVPRGLTAALAAFAIAVTALVARDYINVDAAYRQMRLEKFIVSTEVQPAPDLLLLTDWRDFLVLARTEARPGMDPAWIESMRKVRLRHPHPPILLRYALVAGLNGHPDEALSAMVLLCKIHVPQRCSEGLDSWRQARQKYPQLGPIDIPVEP